MKAKASYKGLRQVGLYVAWQICGRACRWSLPMSCTDASLAVPMLVQETAIDIVADDDLREVLSQIKYFCRSIQVATLGGVLVISLRCRTTIQPMTRRRSMNNPT